MPIIETAHGRLPTGAAATLIALAQEDDFFAVALLREAARIATAAGAEAAAKFLQATADDPDSATDATLAAVDDETALDVGAALATAFRDAEPDEVPDALRDEHAALCRILAAYTGDQA